MERSMELMRVAVIEHADGALAPLADDVVVAVYRRGADGWERESSRTFRVAGESLAGMRERLREFAAMLGSVRMVVAREIGGIAVSVLDQRGFRLCTMDSFDGRCLDALCEEIQKEKTGGAEVAARPAPHPVETDVPGCYVCDLTAILREYPDLSSKKVLRPFLDSTPFVELRVHFGHVPPWLPEELAQRGLSWDDDPGQDVVRIFPPLCAT
jgi:Fe-only nitrogenase accessory protein AnfO